MNRVSRSCRHILEIFCCSTDAGSDIFLWLPDVKYEYMMPVDSPKKCTRTQQCQYVTKFIILPQHTTALKFEFVTQGCHIHFRNQWTLYSVPVHLFFFEHKFPRHQTRVAGDTERVLATLRDDLSLQLLWLLTIASTEVLCGGL